MKRQLLIFALFCIVSYTAASQTPVQVYSFWNSKIHRHFYTTNYDEATSVQAQGWVYDYSSPIVYLLNAPIRNPNTTAVRRYYNASTATHYYTVNNSAPSGFVFESILGYESDTIFYNVGPVYEYYNSGDYYYTKDGGGVSGYHLNGIAYYAAQ